MFRSGVQRGFVLRGRERGGVVHRWRWWRRCWMKTRVVCVLMGEVVMVQLFDVAVALTLFKTLKLISTNLQTRSE